MLRVELRVEQLELARGHDGLLRGAPEPTLVVAVYAATRHEVRLVGRYLYRFDRPGAFPCKVSTAEPSAESCIVVVEHASRIVLLALAIEEDSGRGLQSVYAELDRGDTIVVWAPDQRDALPTHLHELDPRIMAPDLGHRVHVLVDGRELSRQAAGDDWVDAVVLHGAPAIVSRRHRLRFCTPDGRNDWTAELRLSMRRA